MKKRMTSMVLAVTLSAAALLSGCGENTEIATNTTTTASTAPSIVLEATTAATTTTTTTATDAEITTTGTELQVTTKATTTKKVQPTAVVQRPVQTTKAPTSTRPADPSLVMVSAPYQSQNGFPTGCESASAVMLLRSWGRDMSLASFVDNYLDKGAIRYTSSGTVAPHPNDKFVGNPRSSAAYGCYAPVIVRAIEKCLPSGLQVVNSTGSSLPELCRQYIDNGVPVMVWATIDMNKPVRKGGAWTAEGSGERFQWLAGEHCLLLVGYDSERYYLHDPWQSKGLVSYPRATVEARFAELGCQAVGIQRIPTTTTTTTTIATTTTTTTAAPSTAATTTTVETTTTVTTTTTDTAITTTTTELQTTTTTATTAETESTTLAEEVQA